MPLKPRRLFPALAVFMAAFLLSGCVYLRLLELKRQFVRFDECFVLPPSRDFELRFLKPLLLPGDLRWLGAEPRSIIPWRTGEQWSVRWIKQAPSGINEPLVYDMEFIARFENGRLAEAAIPERYFAYFPKDLFVNLLRSTGTARVDKAGRQAEGTTETPRDTPLPNLKSITGMLGEPTRRLAPVDGQVVCIYLYQLDVPQPDSDPVEITFIFDTGSGDLRRLIARLPHGTLKYSFAAKQQSAGASSDAN